MGSRGRKPAAELAVPSRAVALPGPPDTLTDEQAAEWRALVVCIPIGNLGRERWPLIEAYCLHAVELRFLNGVRVATKEDKDFDLADRDRLNKMIERESGILARLAIRLGIAQSSSYDRQKRRAAKRAPWQQD